MEAKKLSMGQILGLGGGALMLIALFLPWFTAKFTAFGESETDSGNAFDFALGWLGALLVIAAAAFLLAAAFGPGFKLGNLKAEQLALLLAGLGTLFILIKLIIGEDLPSELSLILQQAEAEAAASGTTLADLGISIGVSRAFGIFVAFIAGLAVTAGSFLAMKDKGLDIPDAEDFGFGGGDES
jgi:hypothetical protein